MTTFAEQSDQEGSEVLGHIAAMAIALDTMARESRQQTKALEAIAEVLIRLADTDERREEDRLLRNQR